MVTNHIHGRAGAVLQADTINGGVHLIYPAGVEHPVPRQLPAPRLFLDRDQARAWLDRAWAHRYGALWVAVEGSSGIGKTALITHWGHRHQDQWPHGALYTDLARTSADTALRGWLTALGQTHLPADSDQLQALWRTTTAHHRLLVVIENTTAADAHELLPTGAGCAGIATAHQGLADLVAAGARYLRLPALGSDAVGELITRLVQRPVPAPLLQNAVASTGGVPLAATLRAAVLARDLTTPLIETEQENTVPENITTLLDQFPEPTITTAAMVAAHPGPWVSADLVAHLTRTSTDQAHHTLRELVQAALLTDAGQGRYTVHDQVRQPLAARLDTEARTEMVQNLAGFYRRRLAAVDLVLNIWRWRADTEGIALARAAQHGGPWFASRAHALAWIDAELDNIIAVAELLHTSGRPEVWMFVDHIGTYVVLRKPAVAAQLYRWGLESACAHADPIAVGLMLQRLSTTVPQDSHEALDFNTQARQAYEEAGFKQGVASAYESIGSLLGRVGRLEEAEQAQTRSLRLHEEVGNERGAAFQVRRLAEIHTRQGRTAEAKAEFLSSYRTLMALDPPDLYQATRNAEGLIDLLLGQEQETVDLAVVEMLILQGIAAAQIAGSRVQEASLYRNLATLARIRRDPQQEIDHLHQVRSLLDPGHTVAEQAETRLVELRADPR